jgi:3,4-dihydroxy 2-butanone 4-phosphate synthase/GTP cyclohydrolase II
MSLGRPQSDPFLLRLDPLESVIHAFAQGEMVIIVDDADRENEGDLVVATECVTAEHLAFMMKEGRGLICASISVDTAQRLTLPLQVVNNNSPFQTPFAISIDHKSVVPFGVSASARALTMRALTSPYSTASDFVSPGHVFPLIANEAGVMGRQGQTEGSYDLAKLAGLNPSGVICEILHPDGSMLRGEALQQYAVRHQLPITSVAEIRRYRTLHEIGVRRSGSRKTVTDYGELQALVFVDDVGRKEHLALVKGDLATMPASYAPLVRIHSECLTGDVFGSKRCDCGLQLASAMRLIEQEGAGILLYLRQEGRGIGLVNKLKAYGLQDQGLDTVEANVHLGFQPDERDFAVAAHMLKDLGVTQVRLITNNPQKQETLQRLGVRVVERIPSVVAVDSYNEGYLRTKREKMGHLL